jgi:D-glycero-D-manno-heptose 1,7-bisphosphate phosphatase
MKMRYVILDRDGTMIRECDYLTDPEKVELLPNAAEGLRRMIALGLGLVVITNQSAIGRGLLTHARLAEIHARLTAMLRRERIKLDGIYYCPHHPGDQCECRKPKPTLLLQAARELRFCVAECFVIGDNQGDIGLGQSVGARTLLVRTGYGEGIASDPTTLALVNPDNVVADLLSASRVIEDLIQQG